MWEFFPFDGEREWTYRSTNGSLSYTILATMDGNAEGLNGKSVYTVRYTVDCITNDPSCDEGATLYVLRWSSDSVDGTYVHAYGLGEDPFVYFDPPVHITRDSMNVGDVLETESNGVLWTSTMGSFEECPVVLNGTFDSCGTWTVTPSAGDGYPLAGKIWAITTAGVAGFEHASEEGTWRLAGFDCQPLTECDGSW